MKASTMFRLWDSGFNALQAALIYTFIHRGDYAFAAAMAFWSLSCAIEDVWNKLHLQGVR